MENIDFATLFQGFGTMMESGWLLSSARVFLIALGLLLIYLGWKGVLEPMVMIPMGLGMVAINCGTLFIARRYIGESLSGPDAFGYGRLDEYHADRLPATGLHPDLSATD